MIDLVTVRKLEIERIEVQVKADRDSKLSNHDYLVAKQKAAFIEAEADIEKAEKDFPEFLNEIEQKIIANINMGATTYNHPLTYSVRGTYMIKMLLDVLPLHGFICKFNEGKLQISW